MEDLARTIAGIASLEVYYFFFFGAICSTYWLRVSYYLRKYWKSFSLQTLSSKISHKALFECNSKCYSGGSPAWDSFVEEQLILWWLNLAVNFFENFPKSSFSSRKRCSQGCTPLSSLSIFCKKTCLTLRTTDAPGQHRRGHVRGHWRVSSTKPELRVCHGRDGQHPGFQVQDGSLRSQRTGRRLHVPWPVHAWIPGGVVQGKSKVNHIQFLLQNLLYVPYWNPLSNDIRTAQTMDTNIEHYRVKGKSWHQWLDPKSCFQKMRFF